MILLLQSESDKWYLNYTGNEDELDIAVMPCFDVFLHHHMMLELCRRAIRDLPKGCLPLILGATATLIQNVKYPLLPHQTVHKPIARLISEVSRFDALHYTGANISISKKQEMINYKKRIGKNIF
jgi:hypothetical protein